jgi:peptidyl-tRNA hydrolase, PTH1 family
MRLVAGLGNPGERYRRTRHNVGFMVVDVLADRHGARNPRVESDAWVAEIKVADEDVLLVKPLTFMNRSGAAVAPLLEARGLPPEALVAVVDDVALELGTLRVRERGSHGGHNGLRSISDIVGTDEYPRLRVGIGRGEAPVDLAEFVLSDFADEEVLVVQEIVGLAADALECLIREGASSAMNRYNAPLRP